MPKHNLLHFASTLGRVVERCRAWCSSLGIPFFRFSPLISADLPLDSSDNRLLLQMMWETEAYLHQCRDRIHRLASLLVDDGEVHTVGGLKSQ
ncbi:unnamed protein product [Protopolystoma xenopodis]|uniref:Uncharacterized protein n=1 Tax=Protopolystoma xenopodis TaxID=117903 RepID=A0A448X8Q1_9PLAT|nr:unnamed protein product [Protopolystoma xenopodis]